MRVPHYSITELLGAVGFCAVGFASLLYASSPWAGIAFSVALGSLTMGWIAIIYRRNERRAFWVGFLICGWTYLGLIYCPWFSDNVGPQVVTTKILRWAYPYLIPDERQASNPLNALQSIAVPFPELGEGIDPKMTGVDLVDVLAKGKGKESPTLLAQGISYGTSTNNGKLVGVYLQVNPVQFAKLSHAQADRVKLVLQRHRPSPFAGAWFNPPIQVDDYLRVGHSFFGLFGALAGGMAGKYFYSTRDLPSQRAAGEI
jgi:hypothetical protein